MVDSFEALANRIVVTKADKVAFDTDAPSVVQFPDAAIRKTNFAIDFPSYVQKKAYYRGQNQGGGPTLCELWSVLFWQEWGPDRGYANEEWWAQDDTRNRPGPTSRNLPRILLGSVPVGTTFLDVRVKLTRTIAPPPWMGLESPLVLFKQGEWITLPGGSCPTEIIGNTAARHFDIVRIGNDVYLERFQSVRNYGTAAAPDGGPQQPIGQNVSGWNSNADYGEISGASDGSSARPYSRYFIFNQLQRKGYDNDGNKRPGGTNACSAGWSDLTSRFVGDIVITPGRYQAAA